MNRKGILINLITMALEYFCMSYCMESRLLDSVVLIQT